MRHSDSTVGGITFASSLKELQLAYVLGLTLRRYSVPLTVVTRESCLKYADVASRLERCVSLIERPDQSTEVDFDLSLFDLSPYKVTFRFDPKVMLPNTALFLEALPGLSQFGMLSGVPYTLMNDRHSSPSKVHYRQLKAISDSDCVAHKQIFGFTKGLTSKHFFLTMRDLAKEWPKSGTLSKVMPLTSEALYSIAWKKVCGGSPVKGIPFINMDPRMWNTSIPERWPEKLPYSLTPDATLTINSTSIKLPLYYHDDSFLTDVLIENLEAACLQS